MEISLLTISPGAQREPVSTNGFEFLYLVKGNLSYTLGDSSLSLEEGDSLFFNGEIPHVPVNYSETDVILLVIYFIEFN